MDKRLIKLKQRFVSDYNIPIQVFQEPHFTYFLNLYNDEFGYKNKWNSLLRLIESDYQNNPQLFLESYAKVRDNIITSIESNQAYVDFNNADLEKYNSSKQSRDLYIETNDDKVFVSIDMSKANFQALKYYDQNIVFNCEIYEDLIQKFCDNEKLSEYIKDSKYTRQVIFGKLNPKRQIKIQLYIMNKIIKDYLEEKMLGLGLSLYSCSVDEIILEVDTTKKTIGEICLFLSLIKDVILKEMNIDVKAECFKLIIRKFQTNNGSTLNVYEKEFKNNNCKNKLKGVSNIDFPQVYKRLNKKRVNKKDLVFFHNDRIGHYDEKLKLVK